MRYLSTREIQDALLGMLVGADRMLRDHGLRYTLDGGTLLGAVRHRGFIPWDDDIDIMVPRPDFEELCAHPEWMPEGYRLASQGRDGYLYPYAKLFRTDLRAQESLVEGSLEEFLWLDIFPGDSVPDFSKDEARLLNAQKRSYKRAARSFVNIENSVKATANPVKRLAKRVLLPIHRVLFSAEKSYGELSDRSRALPFGSTHLVGNMVWGPYKPDKPGFPVKDFDNLIELDFEGHKFKACPHWDEYLTGLYGDYMTLPPENQRVTHGMKVWRTDEPED